MGSHSAARVEWSSAEPLVRDRGRCFHVEGSHIQPRNDSIDDLQSHVGMLWLAHVLEEGLSMLGHRGTKRRRLVRKGIFGCRLRYVLQQARGTREAFVGPGSVIK